MIIKYLILNITITYWFYRKVNGTAVIRYIYSKFN